MLLSLIFLKRCLIFPILLFSSISLHCSLRKAFLSLLAILWNLNITHLMNHMKNQISALSDPFLTVDDLLENWFERDEKR